LSRDSPAHINDAKLKALVSEAIYLLVDNQYVVASSLSPLFKCVKGSGIGLEHSAAVSSAAFINRVESRFVDNLQHHGVLVWLRYLDDIFVMFESQQAAITFGTFLRGSTDYFEAKTGHVSQTTVDILDLSVTITNNRLVVKPLLAKLPIPLCPCSGHAPHVHRSWPIAVRERVLKLSCGDQNCVSKLLNNYRVVGTHPFTVQLLASGARVKKSVVQSSNIVTCTVRYHPIFRDALKHALKAVPVPESLGFRVRPAYRNYLSSVAGIVNAHNDIMGRDSLQALHNAEQQGIRGGNVFVSSPSCVLSSRSRVNSRLLEQVQQIASNRNPFNVHERVMQFNMYEMARI